MFFVYSASCEIRIYAYKSKESKDIRDMKIDVFVAKKRKKKFVQPKMRRE